MLSLPREDVNADGGAWHHCHMPHPQRSHTVCEEAQAFIRLLHSVPCAITPASTRPESVSTASQRWAWSDARGSADRLRARCRCK